MDSTSERQGPRFHAAAADVRALGVGRAGVHILSCLAASPEAAWLDLAVVDTDAVTLEKATVPKKFLIGAEWTEGKGCGGQAIKGERAMAHKANAPVREFMEGASLLIIVGGFGGGTCTGGASVLARLAREKNIPTIFLVTVPFSFEGAGKREKAERAIESLVKATDVVIAVPNDLLYSSLPADAPSDVAFHKANEEIAKAVLGAAEVLRHDNLLPVDFIDLYNVLRKRKTECGVAIGSAALSDRAECCRQALENLLKSPLLGGPAGLAAADALVVTLTGGPGLSLGETRQLLDAINRMARKGADIVVGANIDPGFQDKLQLTVITIKYDLAADAPPEEPDLFTGPDPAAAKNPPFGETVEMGQPELPFELISRGVFTNTARTNYKGEDLDIPTFQRRRVHIDKGTK